MKLIVITSYMQINQKTIDIKAYRLIIKVNFHVQHIKYRLIIILQSRASGIAVEYRLC